MSPTLSDGDYILTCKPRPLKPGLIYVIDHSDLGRIVKRLTDMENGRFIFEGDNKAASTPSALIATVPQERITRRACLAITKTGIKRI